MRMSVKPIFYLVFALAMSSGKCQDLENKRDARDQDAEASVPGYGLYGGLNNFYGGGIYGGYPGYYNRYYGILNGLGTSGLEYANLGYGGYGGLGYGYNGLGIPGVYSGYNVLGGVGNYYNPYGYYR